ncbi:hypothetical protein [Streptomyces sp. NPDC058766]
MTGPAAARTSTRLPGPTRAMSIRPRQAVSTAVGAAAAWAWSSPAGFAAR